MSFSRKISLGLGVVALAMASTALASSVVSVSTGFSMTDIGRDVGFPGDFDHLDYTGLTNGSITLVPNVPTTVQVNSYIFTAGANSYGAPTGFGLPLASWTIAIDGGAAQTVNQTYDFAIGSSDTITVHSGATMYFDLGPGSEYYLLVTPLGYTTPPNDASAPQGGTVEATMTLVPVPLPASVGIGFSMLAGFGAMFAFRKRLSTRPRIA